MYGSWRSGLLSLASKMQVLSYEVMANELRSCYGRSMEGKRADNVHIKMGGKLGNAEH